MSDQTTPNPIDVISKALAELSAAKSSTDLVYKDLRFLEFTAKEGSSLYGKGLIFTGKGYTKQFVFGNLPEDNFFSTEHINLSKNKSFLIDGALVLSEDSLGSGVTKSNLREVGRLQGLIVDGSLNINQYLFYNGSIDRLGLGTDSPNAAFSVAEMGVEVMLGTSEENHGIVGTFASADLDIVTDNTPRISIKSNGDIDLGSSKRNPVQVRVNGKLSVGVANPDPAVDLHVAGSVRFGGHIHMYADAPPSGGNYTTGDIVWNNSPKIGGSIGWICTRAGAPGYWTPFGEIKQ